MLEFPHLPGIATSHYQIAISPGTLEHEARKVLTHSFPRWIAQECISPERPDPVRNHYGHNTIHYLGKEILSKDDRVEV